MLSQLENHAAEAPVVEAAVIDSGMEYTFLHPALFFQNYAGSWDRVVQTGVLAEPWSTDTRFSRVDYRDVAETAGMALTEDSLLNGTFELASERPRDRHEVAKLIGEVGREIKAERLDPAMLPPEAAPLKVGNAITLGAVLGRPQRTLRRYFEDRRPMSRRSGRPSLSLTRL